MQNIKYKKIAKYYKGIIYNSLTWLISKNGLLITLLWVVSMLHSLMIIDIIRMLMTTLNINYFIKTIINNIPTIHYHLPYRFDMPYQLINIYKNIFNLFDNSYNFEYLLIDIVLVLLWIFSGTKQKYLERYYDHNIKVFIYKLKKYLGELLLILVGDFLYKQILAALYSIWISPLGSIISFLNGLTLISIFDPSNDSVTSFLGVKGILARILWLIFLVLANLIVGKFIQHWTYIYESPSPRLTIILFIFIISIYLIVDEYTRIRFLFLVILVNLILVKYRLRRFKMTKIAEKEIGNVVVRETITPDDVLHINKDGDVLGDLNVNIEIIIKENRKAHLDLVFLLDKSASMYNADRQKNRKKAILDFISNLNENARVSVIYFDNDTDVRTKLTNDLVLAMNEIENMPKDYGGTDYNRAFSKAIEILNDNQDATGSLILKEIEILDENQKAPGSLISKKIIFISDGNPDNGYNYNIDIITKCFEKCIKIYPIGICTHPDSINIFNHMADETGGLSFFAESDQEFLEIFDDISKMIPYELIGTNSEVIKIMPPYFKEIKDLKVETPYKQIYKTKYLSIDTLLKEEDDGTQTIPWDIGTLFAYNSKWILSFRTKITAKLPVSLILSDSSSKKSMFKYVDPKGNPIDGTLPLTEIQFKADPGWIGKMIEYVFRRNKKSSLNYPLLRQRMREKRD